MRSSKVFAGSILLLASVPVALAAEVLVGAGASAIFHLALGFSFGLFAWGAGDFRLPTWLWLPCMAGVGVLALVFLLQGLADVTASAALADLAYASLGQRLERGLGYVFLAWCAGILVWGSAGRARIFGIAALTLIIGIELHAVAAPWFGLTANGALKLLYLPLFAWLLLESLKPADAGH
jgi:hypothetical protein